METADGTTTKDSASSGCLGKLPWRKAPPAAASDKAGAGKDGKETGDEDDDKSSVVSSVASRSALGGWVGRGRAILQVGAVGGWRAERGGGVRGRTSRQDQMLRQARKAGLMQAYTWSGGGGTNMLFGKCMAPY